MKYDEFNQYLLQSEPEKRDKALNWMTAIGLQKVDGLRPSAYLLETAQRHIEGNISIDEVRHLLKSYYDTKNNRSNEDDRTEEADKVSANITKLLNEQTFSFSPTGLSSIHERVFDGVFKFAGSFRTCNISKQEWVLRGESVLYVSYIELKRALQHDFDIEKEFSYKNITPIDMIKHFARFISGIWQIHPFREGNTRTTAVFAIKYLRAMGFLVTNDLFLEHSWFFRNALVRANYRNYKNNIVPDFEPLEKFFRNLLLGENNELRNRNLIINAPQELIPPVVSVNDSMSSLKLIPEDVYCQKIITVIGYESCSVKDIMQQLNLSDRKNFLNKYLTPAINDGFVRMLYPNNLRHPRQKYLLTVKGLTILDELKKLEQ
jgi:fido (protein-threonine AMPylation protein)